MLESLCTRPFLARVVGVALTLLIASCATPPAPPRPVAAAPTKEALRCPTCPSPAAVAAEVTKLRRELALAVPQTDPLIAPSREASWLALTRAGLGAQRAALVRPELVVVVDRNPAVQRLVIVLANPYGSWEMIGGGKVSTGETGVVGAFITPTGVFPHDGSILDYRALGTYNRNHIRGLGIKGMRVWDFGWLTAERGWGPRGSTSEIRMLVHATDPDVLEPRLGTPASQGCVRVSTAMNRFLDLHGVLDRDYETLARYDPAYAAVLSPEREPSILAGDKLVIVDSSQPPD